MRVMALCLAVGCTSTARKPGPSAHEEHTGGEETDSAASDTGRAAAPLRVLLANVGNLDEASGGPCPSSPYFGSTCSIAQEQELSAQIAAAAPDIAVLLEIFDSNTCETSTEDPDLICTGVETRAPYQQIRRLMGDAYTLSCDTRSHRSCVAVRTTAFEMASCPAGDLCMSGSTTAPHPEACDGRGSLTSVSRIDLVATAESPLPESAALAVVPTHALNATDLEGDACREAHYRDALDTLPGADPTLVAGDMNMDPYRFPDLFPSADYWHTRVGDEKRFVALNLDADPPTPTWMDLATLDYVLSDVLEGDCTVLTGSNRLDPSGLTLDHRGVLCTLMWIP